MPIRDRKLEALVERAPSVVGRRLIAMHEIGREGLELLFELAEYYSGTDPLRYDEVLRGKLLGVCFFQPSTRTRLSFESAMQRLGGRVVGFADPKMTRAGDFYQESLEDVIRTVAQYADIVAMRHNETGASVRAAAVCTVPFINGGDGYNQHPTQATGDLWTMHRALGGLDGAAIGMVGSLRIRSLRSILPGLMKFRVRRMLFLLPPDETVPEDAARLMTEHGVPWECFDDVADLLREADLVETIGVRHPDHSLPRDEQGKFAQATPDRYVIDRAKLTRVGRAVPVLHPGPRTDELNADTDDLPNNLYFQQTQNGMWQRMALMTALLSRSLVDAAGNGEAAEVASRPQVPVVALHGTGPVAVHPG
jgi:aspartate carbamoyltransferase catalytic subunit